jgi:hypothetical protein
MPHGVCVLLSESGQPYAVRADYGNDQLIDLDIPYYEQMGYLPPWRSLDPCPGTGPKRPKRP